jgi:hypothetical protein
MNNMGRLVLFLPSQSVARELEMSLQRLRTTSTEAMTRTSITTTMPISGTGPSRCTSESAGAVACASFSTPDANQGNMQAFDESKQETKCGMSALAIVGMFKTKDKERTCRLPDTRPATTQLQQRKPCEPQHHEIGINAIPDHYCSAGPPVVNRWILHRLYPS